MEATSILGAIRRRWWIVVLFAFMGAAAGAIPQPEKATIDPTSVSYSAAHTLLISSSSIDGSIYSNQLVNQLQLFAVTGEVPKRVSKAIGYTGAPADLASQVTVEVDQSTGAIRISTTQASADLAVTVADTFGDELAGYISERQDDLQSKRIAATLARLTDLEKQVKDLEGKAAATPSDQVIAAQLDALTRQYSVVFEQFNNLQVDTGQLQLTTLEKAEAIEKSSGRGGLAAPTSRSSRGLLLGGVGAVAGFGLVVLLAKLDRRIRSRMQAELVFGMRSQVTIPPLKKGAGTALVVAEGRHDLLSDAYRTLRSVVGFIEGGVAAKEGRAPIILVVSSGPGDGKTSVSANLAVAFVETGLRTVAVNTDFRRPQLSQRILGKRPEPMAFALEDLSMLSSKRLLSPSNIDDLALFDLAGVKASPGDLARETARRIPELAEIASVVVVDSSPIGVTAEVLELVPIADVIVVVTRVDHSSTDSAKRTMEILRALTTTDMALVVVGEAPERTTYYEYSAPAAKESGRRGWRGKRDEE